jgi:hypothetical protein
LLRGTPREALSQLAWAQVLGRIEELEEREREELLSELVPAMETRRYGAGALKTVMGD